MANFEVSFNIRGKGDAALPVTLFLSRSSVARTSPSRASRIRKASFVSTTLRRGWSHSS